jgi:hypothetical protein
MTSFLWTLSDLENLRMGYLYGLFDYDEFRTRHAKLKAENVVRPELVAGVPDVSAGRSGDRSSADQVSALVDVSGELINKAQLPHRATRSSSGLKEQGS